VEVKTRMENSLVSPGESVDNRKQERIRLAAQNYLLKTVNDDKQPRFDVAEVTVFTRDDGTNGYNLNYIKNAF